MTQKARKSISLFYKVIMKFFGHQDHQVLHLPTSSHIFKNLITLAIEPNAMKYSYPLITFALTLLFAYTHAQERPSVNFYENIKNYNLHDLWTGDSIIIEDGPERRLFPEPIGFIGDNFQRFYIHYTSVIKSKDTPYLYHVTGKTRVKNNICNFRGQIYIQKAVLYTVAESPAYSNLKSGSVSCQITLYEDSTQNGSGMIKGKLVSDFYLDKGGRVHYSGLMFTTDFFYNNSCEAIWTSYKTGISKKCNWGDFRIPGSGQMDNGVSEFHVIDKYVRNGWENYRSAWTGNPEAPEVVKARAEEFRKWWL